MNAEGFAQVPDLDEQLNSPSTAVNALRQHASSFDDDMYAHQFNKQTPYLGQDGSLPQHFMQGVPDMNAGQSFPLGRSTPSVNMFTTVNAPVSSSGAHPADKPTPAQAAAGRLCREPAPAKLPRLHSSRSARLSPVLQPRRKREASRGRRERRTRLRWKRRRRRTTTTRKIQRRRHWRRDKLPKPHEIAKTKYNHVEDEKERKDLSGSCAIASLLNKLASGRRHTCPPWKTSAAPWRQKTAALESKINTLERENFMLRQVVKNSTKAGNEKMGMALAADEPRAVPSH